MCVRKGCKMSSVVQSLFEEIVARDSCLQKPFCSLAHLLREHLTEHLCEHLTEQLTARLSEHLTEHLTDADPRRGVPCASSFSIAHPTIITQFGGQSESRHTRHELNSCVSVFQG